MFKQVYGFNEVVVPLYKKTETKAPVFIFLKSAITSIPDRTYCSLLPLRVAMLSHTSHQ